MGIKKLKTELDVINEVFGKDVYGTLDTECLITPRQVIDCMQRFTNQESSLGMNIIQAFQKAENGALITNNFLKHSDMILKYMGNGVFFQYEIEEGKPLYKYEVREFSLGQILSIGWEVVEGDYFN